MYIAWSVPIPQNTNNWGLFEQLDCKYSLQDQYYKGIWLGCINLSILYKIMQ
jgi:hypothetical protein